MIISDLSYLEVVSEVPSIVGGVTTALADRISRLNDITSTQLSAPTAIGTNIRDIISSNAVEITASNDNL